MTTPPEGYHPDKNGDNCKVRIEGVWVTVAQLAKLYTLAMKERHETHENYVSNFNVMVLRRAIDSHDTARREAGLDGGK